MKNHISAAGALVLWLLLTLGAENVSLEEVEAQIPKRPQVDVTEGQLYGGVSDWQRSLLPLEDLPAIAEALTFDEHEVYTFLQGPRAWSETTPWSGEWCQLEMKGNSFGNFGCGFCCIANIYDTLSPYEASPWDLCEYATTVSGYSPTKKVGAIGWGDMKTVLQSIGMECDVYYKPSTYEAFQEQMARTKSAIVLVSSKEDDTYWKNTPGHYVNIWLYEEESDMVFLAEPGSPENNRSFIPLRYVYDALKTSSQFQYLAVEDYTEENNSWKFDGIDEVWNGPDQMTELAGGSGQGMADGGNDGT